MGVEALKLMEQGTPQSPVSDTPEGGQRTGGKRRSPRNLEQLEAVYGENEIVQYDDNSLGLYVTQESPRRRPEPNTTLTPHYNRNKRIPHQEMPYVMGEYSISQEPPKKKRKENQEILNHLPAPPKKPMHYRDRSRLPETDMDGFLNYPKPSKRHRRNRSSKGSDFIDVPNAPSPKKKRKRHRRKKSHASKRNTDLETSPAPSDQFPSRQYNSRQPDSPYTSMTPQRDQGFAYSTEEEDLQIEFSETSPTVTFSFPTHERYIPEKENRSTRKKHKSKKKSFSLVASKT